MHELSLQEMQKEWHGTYKAYWIGFALSLILTSLSFGTVVFAQLSGDLLVYTLVALALAQAIVQLIFFLHVGQEAKPKWETIVFAFMVLVLLIIAVGSLWIMHDLNMRVMSDMMPHQGSA